MASRPPENVVLFILIGVLVVPLTMFLNRKQGHEWTRRSSIIGGILAIAGSFVIFVIPFVFIILMAFKDQPSRGCGDFSWPVGFHLWDNLVTVVTTRNMDAGHGLHQLDPHHRHQRDADRGARGDGGGRAGPAQDAGSTARSSS